MTNGRWPVIWMVALSGILGPRSGAHGARIEIDTSATPPAVRVDGQRYGPVASAVEDFTEIPSRSAPPVTAPAAPTTAPAAQARATPPADIIKVRTAPAGLATFFDGRALVPEDQRTGLTWTWDFGDPGGAHNVLKGFNSAHIYERPGTYTIKLTIGDKVYHRQVIVPRSTRRVIQVPAGSDLHQYTNARNVELVLVQGATYTAGDSVICQSDVVIRGNGATLNLQASVEGFRLGSNCRLSGLRIDYPAGANPKSAQFGPVNMAIFPMGPAVTVDGCTFLNVGYCVNGNAKPDNVLVQDCNAPLLNGLRGYLAWVEGGAWTIVGNTVKNPFIEHDVRCESGAGPLAIVDNHLDNLGQADSGVKGDNPKGSIVLHYTVDAYVAGNTVATYGTDGGGIGAGPLMVTFSQANPERTRRTVIEDNTLNDAPVRLDPGAIDTVIRGNVFNVPADHPHPFDAAIVIRSIDGARGRDVERVVIRGNRIEGSAQRVSITQGQVRGLVSDWQAR